uniref:Uncharacterized protein n=1 Tax=Panagrolaimus superbus TaxID=310955 RepID=A0A914Y4H5_9BILA
MKSPTGKPDSSPSSGSSVTSFNKNLFVVVDGGGNVVVDVRVDLVEKILLRDVVVGIVVVEVEEEILRGFCVPTSIQRLSRACGPFDAIRIDFVVFLSSILGGHALVNFGAGVGDGVEDIVAEGYDKGGVVEGVERRDVSSSKNVKDVVGGGGDVVDGDKAEGKIGEKNPPKILDLSGNFGAGTRNP